MQLYPAFIARLEARMGAVNDDLLALKSLGTALGVAPRQIVRPSRTENVVQQGNVNFVPTPGADNRDAVGALAMARFPDLMARLGYAPGTAAKP